MWKTDLGEITGRDPGITGEIRVIDNRPQLFVDGTYTPPYLFFGNSEAEGWEANLAKEIRLAAERGIHLYSLVMHLPFVETGKTPDFSHFEKVMSYTLKADPQGLIIPRICMQHPPESWWREHCPEALAVYASGESGPPNIASEEWFRQEKDALLAMLDFVRSRPDFDRHIIGYHVFPQYVGEWMSLRGHCDGVDLSEANRLQFAGWLAEKYGDDAALSAAWGREAHLRDVALPIPPHNKNFQEQSSQLFLDTRKQRDILDLYDFISDLVARRITELSEVIKRGTNGKSLVMQFYGYLFELGDAKCGHQSLKTVLDCPYVDMLCSPVGYLDRMEGGILSFMAPVDSVAAHRKLWMVEDDTKTCLEAPEDEQIGDPFNRRVASMEDTLRIHKRNMAAVLAHDTGIWWMDLWSRGWLNSPVIWDSLRELCDFSQRYHPMLEGGMQPEAAVVVDEDGIKALYNPWEQGKALLQQNMPALYRSGISFGLYLLDDVLEGAAASCQLYIIIGAYNLTSEKKEQIRRLQTGGRTVLWVYGADTAQVEEEQDLTGFRLRRIEGPPFLPLLDLPGGVHPLYQTPVSPAFAVEDEEAESLARFIGRDETGYAVKRFDGWNSLYYGSLTLSEEAVRQAARIAGVHVYVDTNDVVTVNQNFLSLYARTEGIKHVKLPFCSDVFDEKGQCIHKGVGGFDASFACGECRYYVYRPAEQ